MPWIVVGLVVVGLAVIVIAIQHHQRDRGPGPARGLDQVLAAHGPARCLEATRLLARLAERGGSQAIAATWARLEMPLLEALPDCPPDAKAPLANALDAAALACRVVNVSRGLVTMRNALVS